MDADSELRSALGVEGLLQAEKFSSAAYKNKLREMYGKIGMKNLE